MCVGGEWGGGERGSDLVCENICVLLALLTCIIFGCVKVIVRRIYQVSFIHSFNNQMFATYKTTPSQTLSTVDQVNLRDLKEI